MIPSLHTQILRIQRENQHAPQKELLEMIVGVQNRVGVMTIMNVNLYIVKEEESKHGPVPEAGYVVLLNEASPQTRVLQKINGVTITIIVRLVPSVKLIHVKDVVIQVLQQTDVVTPKQIL
jgi:hypothetical protein